jgi:hypothetical protein
MDQQTQHDEKDMRWWLDEARKQLAIAKELNARLDKQIAENKDDENKRSN